MRYCFCILTLLGMTILYAQNQESQNIKQQNTKFQEQPESKENSQVKSEQTFETEKTWTLDEVVVTPSAYPNQQFKEPALIYKQDQKDIQNKRLVRTVPEALKEIPGVIVQKTSHGQGSPFIRGFTGFRTLFLIDGIRLNNSIFREGPNQYSNTVDHFSISALEVVKGPGAILYGSDAVGGVVNIITRERENYENEQGINGRAYYRYASGEDSHIGRTEVSGNVGENIGVLGGFTYKSFGNIRAGNSDDELPKTGYDELGADFKLNVFLSENAEWVVGYYLVNQDNAERTHKTIFSKSFRGTEVGDELRRRLDHDRQLGYTQLRLYDLDGFIQTATFTVSWHYQSEKQDRIRSNLRRDIQGITTNTLGLLAKFTSETDIGKWVYGLDYYRDHVRSFRQDFNADGTLRARRIQGAVGDRSTYDLLAVYIQNEISAFDFLTLIPGVRYTHAWTDADEIQDPLTGNEISFSDDWGSFTGSFKFIAAIDKNWNAFGGVSQSFRTPNLSDLTRFDTARSNEIETPVRNLDPEYFITYELGFKAHYERKFYFQFSYFYTQIFDMIVRFPTGNVIDGDFEVTKDNVGDGYVHGVELGATYYFIPEWRVFSGFSWVEGRVSTFPDVTGIEKDEVIDRLSPAQGFIGLGWTHSSDKYWVEGLLTIVRDQTRLSTRDKADTQRIPPGGTPGYVIGTIRAGAKISENLTVSASVENIGNVNYRVHGAGQNEPGINFIFGVDAGF